MKNIVYLHTHDVSPVAGTQCDPPQNDHGCGVMFLLRIPGAGNGTVTDAPGWLEGSSRCPLLDGEKEDLHDAVFAEINYHAARDRE